MHTLGIEEARKTLGDVVDRADRDGEPTYLTRHGRAVAVVVPALRTPRRNPGPISTAIPVHYTHTEQGAPLEPWHCTCGATGVESDDEFASTLALAHEHDAAAPILRALPAAELATLLRASARDNWQLTAAFELLIAHDVWLHEQSLRAYLEGRWASDHTFLVYVRWSALVADLGIHHDAVNVLTCGGAPDKAVTAVQQWANDYDTGLPALDGSASQLAVLRIAASIANNLPIRMFDDPPASTTATATAAWSSPPSGTCSRAAAASRSPHPPPGPADSGYPDGSPTAYFRAGGRPILSMSGGRGPLGPGIDIRSPGRRSGGYLVGPGSVVDGRRYVIVRAAPIAPLPDWLAELLTAPVTDAVSR